MASEQKSDWRITSPDDDKFQVDLADCTREHAQSVVAQLEQVRPNLKLAKRRKGK